MKSPFTGENVTLHFEEAEIIFRKEPFKVISQYYTCDNTGEEFTTTEQDELTINQVYNQYRAKYGIPFTDEINEILNNYDISASKISKILGFGDNQYLKYTKGEIPSVSNGRMIAQIKDVTEFRKLLDIAKNEFNQDELLKIEKKISHLGNKEINFLEQLILNSNSYSNKRNIYTGYVQPNIEKIKNIVLFFVNKCNGAFETKLNKLLFYSDFLCFKETGKGLSGLTYKAIQFGPIPDKYSTIYDNVGGTDFEIIYQPSGNNGKKIIGTEEFNPNLFSKDELSVLNKVYNKFKNYNTEKISLESHNESAWIENKEEKGLIKYSYGFMLKSL